MNISMLASMNFSNLTTEGYAAFVLSLIFTIVSIAGFIYYGTHKEAGKVALILTTLVFPVITIFFWMYLIMNVWSYSIPVSLGVAFGTAIGYAIVAIAIAYLVIYIKNHKTKKAEEQKVVEETTETKQTEETTEETIEETKLLNAPEENTEIVEETAETTEEEKTENVEAESTETAEQSTETTENTEEEPVEQGVVFSNEPKKTFDEQLAALDEDRRNYFNEIFEYAMEKPETKCSKAKYHRMVKIGAMKLLDAKFSKDALICNFMAGSSELKNYSKKEKAVKIKEKPVILEIDSAESVNAAKSLIDIVYKNISDAKEERAEEKKAKRRKPRKTTEDNGTESGENQTEGNGENA